MALKSCALAVLLFPLVDGLLESQVLRAASQSDEAASRAPQPDSPIPINVISIMLTAHPDGTLKAAAVNGIDLEIDDDLGQQLMKSLRAKLSDNPTGDTLTGALIKADRTLHYRHLRDVLRVCATFVNTPTPITAIQPMPQSNSKEPPIKNVHASVILQLGDKLDDCYFIPVTSSPKVDTENLRVRKVDVRRTERDRTFTVILDGQSLGLVSPKHGSRPLNRLFDELVRKQSDADTVDVYEINCDDAVPAHVFARIVRIATVRVRVQDGKPELWLDHRLRLDTFSGDDTDKVGSDSP